MSKLSLVTTPRSAQYKYGNSLRGHRLNLNQSEPVKGFFRVIRNVHKFREEGSWGQKLRGGEVKFICILESTLLTMQGRANSRSLSSCHSTLTQ